LCKSKNCIIYYNCNLNAALLYPDFFLGKCPVTEKAFEISTAGYKTIKLKALAN